MAPARPGLAAVALVVLVSTAPAVAGVPTGESTAVTPVVDSDAGDIRGIDDRDRERSNERTTVANGSTMAVQRVVYRLTPDRAGSIRVTTDYRTGPNVSKLVVYGDQWTTVLDSRGFVERPNGRWVWNGTVPDPSLTLRVTVNRTGPTFRGFGWVDTGDWALVHPRVPFALYNREVDRWVYSWRNDTRIEQHERVDGEGVVGSSVVYLGPHETVRTTARNTTIRVVRPNATSGTNVTRALATVVAASEQLRVGARDELLTVFLGPDPLRPGGMTTGGNGSAQDFWVSAGAPVSAPDNVWVHEYVHTRQSLTLGPRMEWFREASASYYAGLLSVRQGVGGRAGYDSFQARLRDNGSTEAVLTDWSTWENRYAPYERGARVLAALDARIRNETGGNRTLQAVFRRLNARDGVVTYGEFVGTVANVSGGSQRAWLDAHVAGNATVSPPRNPFVYTSPRPGTDADGDGLSDAAERTAGTHPFDPDTDDDGVPDGLERLLGLLPAERQGGSAPPVV